MHAAWRSSTLAVGIGLVVLGAGNWGVSRARIAEHEQRVTSVEPADRDPALDQFRALTPRTNRTLLQRLNRGHTEYTTTEAKLDFYRIVESGGRILALLGMLLITVAMVRGRRRASSAPLPPPPADESQVFR